MDEDVAAALGAESQPGRPLGRDALRTPQAADRRAANQVHGAGARIRRPEVLRGLRGRHEQRVRQRVQQYPVELFGNPPIALSVARLHPHHGHAELGGGQRDTHGGVRGPRDDDRGGLQVGQQRLAGREGFGDLGPVEARPGLEHVVRREQAEVIEDVRRQRQVRALTRVHNDLLEGTPFRERGMDRRKLDRIGPLGHDMHEDGTPAGPPVMRGAATGDQDQAADGRPHQHVVRHRRRLDCHRST